jgi:hypothetical protein
MRLCEGFSFGGWAAVVAYCKWVIVNEVGTDTQGDSHAVGTDDLCLRGVICCDWDRAK